MPDPYLWEGVPAGRACWHIHHGVLLEWSFDPLAERAEYIGFYKPAYEVEIRLRLMRPVKGELPIEVVETGRALAEADRKYCEADMAYGVSGYICGDERKARARAAQIYAVKNSEFEDACIDHAGAINALHKAECPDCPWDGTTIFPEEKP